jgi:hypothetical protein
MIRGKACGLEVKAIDKFAPTIGRDRPYHPRNVIENLKLRRHGVQSRV